MLLQGDCSSKCPGRYQQINAEMQEHSSLCFSLTVHYSLPALSETSWCMAACLVPAHLCCWPCNSSVCSSAWAGGRGWLLAGPGGWAHAALQYFMCPLLACDCWVSSASWIASRSSRFHLTGVCQADSLYFVLITCLEGKAVLFHVHLV